MPVLIEIDSTELEGLAIKLEADGRMMRASARVAANRAMRWARVQVARGMSSRLGLPAAVLRKRFKSKNATAKASRASLWVGLNPVNVARLRPRKTSSGLRAGSRTFAGAFVATGRYGGKVALKRAGSARLPLEGVSVRVYDPTRAFLKNEAWPGVQDKFLQFFNDELEKRLSK